METPKLAMKFEDVFQEFWEEHRRLKVVFVASSDEKGVPNCAPKMLVNVIKPNKIYFLDYRFTHTFANISKNGLASVSFMDDRAFKGYRLNGRCRQMLEGPQLDAVKEEWTKRLVSYETDRILERMKGGISAREAENFLPSDFTVIEMTADEACLIQPDRVLRALHQGS